MSSLFPLLFAPSFLLFIRFVEFKSVVLVYISLALLFFMYAILHTKKNEDLAISTIYLGLLCLAYISNDFYVVKLIPVLIALSFSGVFYYGAVKKKELIYGFTRKFYKKALGEEEEVFLKKGDSLWAYAIFTYALVLGISVFFASDETWAFLSSIGWYIYFLFLLISQIIYGKFYAIKMLTK